MTDKHEAEPFIGFEWDENKRRLNIAKHRIDFANATEVFSDPNQRTFRSLQKRDEVRYISVGNVRGTLMAVVFVSRIRIISARNARRKERELYG